MYPSSLIRKPDPPLTSRRGSSCCSGAKRRRCSGPKKNSNGSPWKGARPPRPFDFTVSVEVMLTTAGLTLSAMSANETGAPMGAPCPAASWARAAACRGRSSAVSPAACPGVVRWRPPATTMPKIIEAAAINASVTG